MIPMHPFAVLKNTCAEATRWATFKLEQAGFQAIRTFDLQIARVSQLGCTCPHHGTEKCNCQMVVMLVYQGNNPPLTMVIHGNDQASSFFLINTPLQPIESPIGKKVQETLNLQTNAEL